MIMSQADSNSITAYIEDSFLQEVSHKDIPEYFNNIVAPSIRDHIEEYGFDDIVEHTGQGLPVTAGDIFHDGRRIAYKYIGAL